MSVFSKIRMSRKAAKEHKEKAAEKDQVENAVVKAPYKHIPTHAAVDALSGAPATWQVEDRPKIKEQHKRRSQMAISRTGSSLSTMSYAVSSSQHPPLPRNSSYSSYSPAWFDRAGESAYSYHPTENPQKRYKPSRSHSYQDSAIGPSIGPSPLVSNMHSEEVSPVVSSGNSTNSNSSDNLEIAVNTKERRMSQKPQPTVYGEKDIFTRLHTSTTRKLGEAPIGERPAVLIKPAPAVAVVAQEQKQKRQRWSLRGKRNTATIVV